MNNSFLRQITTVCHFVFVYYYFFNPHLCADSLNKSYLIYFLSFGRIIIIYRKDKKKIFQHLTMCNYKNYGIYDRNTGIQHINSCIPVYLLMFVSQSSFHFLYMYKYYYINNTRIKCSSFKHQEERSKIN